ncbi:hypothetical protein B9Z55_003365 [Caenorhabditis nigoni]|uniref:DUF281 domain-containing protein n=2 Tax=Caenorhabditis nigoni TaxID=1611254 RepID=A0A2G5VPU0_9PELO|nr:hypothetical protein B9Z55_003365 [Caenorhabditis nigoni]
MFIFSNTAAMKLYCVLFLLAVILKFSDPCLVIRYSEPPACACKTLKLDSLNIRENRVSDSILYNFVYSSTIEAPEIIVDDCFVQMYCEDGYELYIFDTDKGAKIGDYSLDGFCNPFPQKWQVDTGNGIEEFKELKGVCVMKAGCVCPFIEMDSSNIDVYLGENESYKNYIKGYLIQKPEITQYKEDGCPHRRQCPEGSLIYTVWDPLEQDLLVEGFSNVTWTSDCRPNNKNWPWILYYWRPEVLQSVGRNFLSAFCVDYYEF